MKPSIDRRSCTMTTPDPNAGHHPARNKDDPGWAPESGDKPDAAQPPPPASNATENDSRNEPRRRTPGAPSHGAAR
jgi:hypothetical protein